MARPLTRKLAIALSVCSLSLLALSSANAQRRSLTLRADMQQANAKTGVITANGNVQLSYPARQIQATANAANYYSRERRIVLSGDVYVLQAGSSLRAETITYLIDEGRFVALPQNQKQVEATILIPEDNDPPIQQ
jgi:lipopolysaccharide export system protein LptA